MAPRQDPFYVIRVEIQDSTNELQQKMSRFHGLTAANPERRTVAQDVEQGCDSLMWQLKELEGAVEHASVAPERYNLTMDELASRRKWIDTTRRQVVGMVSTLRTATAAPAPAPTAQDRVAAANDKWLGSQQQQQQQILAKQDQDLDEVEASVLRIGRVSKAIGNELVDQEKLLKEVEDDVDTLDTRIKGASKKMAEIIRKSGSTTQLVLIAFLIVVLLVLAVLAFM